MLNRSLAVCALILFLSSCGVPPDVSGDVAGTVSDTGTDTAPSAPAEHVPAADITHTTPTGSHHRCGWVFTSDPVSATSFTQHAAWFDAIHPIWYALQSDGVTVRQLADGDDPAILEAARAAHVAVIPLVASVENTDWTRKMMRDPGKRAAHVKTLVALAESHGYEGLDLDYEHLWDAADAAPLAAFVDEVSAAMHAAGKSISMAVPALDRASKVWSYVRLAAALDRVHLMGYDFHTIGTHPGPTAPLGWIDAVGVQAAASGHPERFVLGLPNYGVGKSSSCPLAQCASTCTSPATDGSDELASCPLNEHHYGAGGSKRCNTSKGTIYFDDVLSLATKAKSAVAHGMAGITYWNLGGEPAGFFEALKAAVP